MKRRARRRLHQLRLALTGRRRRNQAQRKLPPGRERVGLSTGAEQLRVFERGPHFLPGHPREHRR